MLTLFDNQSLTFSVFVGEKNEFKNKMEIWVFSMIKRSEFK